MKKKIVSKWLHRLPVLLLVFILAVSPLLMAVPSFANQPYGDADVLSGLTNYYSQVEYLDKVYDIPLPIKPSIDKYEWNILAFVYDSAGYNVYYTASNFKPYLDSNGGLRVHDIFGEVYHAVFNFDQNGLLVQVQSWDESYLNTIPNVDAVGWFVNDPGLNIFSFEVSYSVVKAGGILNVFDGVGSWLSGVVKNISTMFWTAESGMTVLGYLAVASLALAVILLIFYLIAGWLRFH